MFRVSLACETWCGLWFVSSLKPIWSSNLSVKEKLIVLVVFSSPLSMWSFPRWLNFWCNVDWAHRRWMWQMLQGGVAFYRESTFWITLPGCSYWCHVYLNGWMYMYVCLSVCVCLKVIGCNYFHFSRRIWFKLLYLHPCPKLTQEIYTKIAIGNPPGTLCVCVRMCVCRAMSQTYTKHQNKHYITLASQYIHVFQQYNVTNACSVSPKCSLYLIH